jgi:hypothetical protein
MAHYKEAEAFSNVDGQKPVQHPGLNRDFKTEVGSTKRRSLGDSIKEPSYVTYYLGPPKN